MKQLIDFIPLLVFFICFKFYDIYVASGAMVVAAALALLFNYLRDGKIEKMALFTFVMIAFFGTLTLTFKSAIFIKWKVTIVYGIFSIGLLLSQFVFKQTLIQKMLGKELTLPTEVWNKLNLAWALFFLFCGVINIYVAFWLPEEVWVNFKVFGLTGLTLIFTLANGVYLYRHLSTNTKDDS